MVTTFETCNGPRAYAGVVSAYFETTTKDFVRLTDQAWTDKLKTAPPETVPWLRDLIVP